MSEHTVPTSRTTQAPIERMKHPARGAQKRSVAPGWDDVRALALRVARARLRDESAAEEVAQEALLRLWRTRARLTQVSSPEAWVVRVVHNEVLRYVDRRDRRHGRELPSGGEDIGLPAPEATTDLEDGVWLRQGVRALGEVDRQIVLLHYFADVPLPSVAAGMGMPLGSVKARVHRARKKLAVTLEA